MKTNLTITILVLLIISISSLITLSTCVYLKKFDHKLNEFICTKGEYTFKGM